MATTPSVEQIGRAIRKGIGPGKSLKAPLPKIGKVQSLGKILQPANLPMGPEDVIGGVRAANRRRMVSGVLGSRTPVGTPGARSFYGRTRRLGR